MCGLWDNKHQLSFLEIQDALSNVKLKLGFHVIIDYDPVQHGPKFWNYILRTFKNMYNLGLILNKKITYNNNSSYNISRSN